MPQTVSSTPEPEINVPLSSAIDYIRAEATEKAIAAARERLNFFLYLTGVTGAVSAFALTVGATFYISERIDSAVGEKTTSILEEIRIPLIATTIATEIEQSGGYSPSLGDDLLKTLDSSLSIDDLPVAARIQILGAFEKAADTFLKAQDFFRLKKLYAAGGAELLNDEGIYFTLALGKSVEIVLQAGRGLPVDSLETDLLESTLDPNGTPFELQAMLMVVRKSATSDWDPNVALQELEPQVARHEAFSQIIEQLLDILSQVDDGETSPATKNATQVLSEAFQAAQP